MQEFLQAVRGRTRLQDFLKLVGGISIKTKFPKVRKKTGYCTGCLKAVLERQKIGERM
jgi:hypothetical protein